MGIIQRHHLTSTQQLPWSLERTREGERRQTNIKKWTENSSCFRSLRNYFFFLVDHIVANQNGLIIKSQRIVIHSVTFIDERELQNYIDQTIDHKYLCRNSLFDDSERTEQSRVQFHVIHWIEHEASLTWAHMDAHRCDVIVRFECLHSSISFVIFAIRFSLRRCEFVYLCSQMCVFVRARANATIDDRILLCNTCSVEHQAQMWYILSE